MGLCDMYPMTVMKIQDDCDSCTWISVDEMTGAVEKDIANLNTSSLKDECFK
jgi:hypothetical protein